MGRVLHRHTLPLFLMVVGQINIACGIGLLVIAETQAPISGDGQAPMALQVSLERMQVPTGKAFNLGQIPRRFEDKQDLAQLIHHRRRQPPGHCRPRKGVAAHYDGSWQGSSCSLSACTAKPYKVNSGPRLPLMISKSARPPIAGDESEKILVRLFSSVPLA